MLVASIDVSLSPHNNDTVEVMDVDMNKHPKKSAEYLLADLKEVLRKGNTCEQRRLDCHNHPVILPRQQLWSKV